jgi:hypothetical protein
MPGLVDIEKHIIIFPNF